jgi:tetratricopeptide (TPR) repeat protein
MTLLFAMALSAAACVDAPTEHRVRANAYLRAGDANKALAEVEAGLAKKPNDVALLIMRGKALFELERYDDARTAYRKAIEQAGPKDRAVGEAYLGLAMAALRQNDTKEARASLEQLVNLARVCLQLKDMDCALTHAEAAGRLRGNSEEVLFTLGRIYAVTKKLDEAEKTFAHICEVVPNAASCPYGQALVAAQRGDKDRAIAKLNEAITRRLPNPDRLGDDALLAPLAEDARFKELIAKAKK